MNCPICGTTMDTSDSLEVALELRAEPIRICDTCAQNVAEALFTNKTVKVWMDDGNVMMEVLP